MGIVRNNALGLKHARSKDNLIMKGIAVLLLVVLAMSACSAGPVKKGKRFLIKEVGDFFNNAFNSVSDFVNSFHFDKAVEKLVPMIHSGMTESACITACEAGAATVLGPAAFMAGDLCKPCCATA